MSTNWTKEQLAVIENRDSNLLVSAAAGSGKTAVLIERIVRLILDEKNPIDINRLLVVTFTKAAASEMKERVRTSIEKKLEENSDNIHLQKQLILLNQAEITTIDSFCGHILKDNFHLTDLSPNIKVGDPTEIQIISNEVMEDFFDYLYRKKDDRFLKLVDWYSNRNSDRELINLLLNINNFVNSSPNPNKWLLDSANFFDDKDDDFYIENYFVEFSKDVKMIVNSFLSKIKMILKEVENYEDLDKYRFGYLEFIELVEIVLEKLDYFIDFSTMENWEEISNFVKEFSEIKFSTFKIPSKTDEFVKEFYNSIKDILKKSRDEIKNEILKLSFSIEDIKKENEIVYPYMKAISEILIEFREKFLEKKKSMGILDFADIEHYALDILREYDENGEIIPSKVSLEYQDLFEEVFIDEYQDSNYVQEMILSLVSRKEKPNRFMVGDVKQSIYRFRQAMPKIFMEKYNEYDLYTDLDSKNKKIMLYNNFRSRKEVLESCNLIFSKIMRKDTGELDYTVDERLNPTAKFEDFEDDLNIGGAVEIHIAQENYDEEEFEIDDSESEDFDEIKSFRLECLNIANIIKSSVNQKDNKKSFKVFDNKLGVYRNLEYRDIVILMRSPNKNVTIFEEVFGECSIPIYTEGDSGYFNTFEVDTIVNLLKIIDNPMQDIPILSVMRSPIFNFDTREFSAIRLVDKEKNFYELLVEITSENFEVKEFCNNYELEESFVRSIIFKINKMLSDIKIFREKSNLIPIDEFIWYLLKETGYYDYVGLLEMGSQRQNNLMLLFERARNFEKTSYKGLFNFVNYIERVKNRNADLGEAKTISEDANVVRLMSIHKSKGLEFPVVILANCDKKFNLKSGDTNLILHQNLGFGPRIFDVEKAVSFESLYKKKIENIQKKEQIAEEMRLLYVAMTRAKEKLIISARVKDFEKSMAKWESVSKDFNDNISDLEVINSKSYLDWIMYVVSSFSNENQKLNICGENSFYKKIGESEWSFSLNNKSDIFEKYNKFTKNIILNDKLEEKEFDFEFDDELINRVSNYKYKFENSINKPSSISVSEVKRIMLEDNNINYENIYSNKIINLKTPNFLHLSKDISFSSAEKGTIFHLAMQLLDFSKFENFDDFQIREEVSRQLEDFVKRDIITKEEMETVNISWIVKFIKSEVFKEIFYANSVGKLYKEKVIYHNIKINDIYKDDNILNSERLMVVGIIDLFYEREDGIVLLDYKTDKINKDNFESVVSRYNIQLDLYKKAIEDISGKKVVKKAVYFMSIGELVEY